MYKQKDSKRNKMKGWKYEGKRHGLAAQGILTGRKIREYSHLDLEGDARSRDLKEFSKLLEVIELLKKDNVNAVDLSAHRLTSNSPFIKEFVNQIEGLEIVGNEIRKVDRVAEIQRFIEIREANIKKYEEELKTIPKHIEEEKLMLEEAKMKLKSKNSDESVDKDILEGGLADKKKDSDFNEADIREGAKVELEHTNDIQIAREIAKDHLTEDKDYYEKLKKMEGKQSNLSDYKNKEVENKPKLKLVETDGNAFALLGKARRVAIENKMDWDKIQKESTSGDYDHLLQTLMKYFEVE